MVWIKICGITNAEDALKVSDLGADALGFIFSTDSARKINSEDAKKIIITVTEKFKNNPIKKQPSMVGVFVNE
ncbi:MAG: hypothetical protein M1409_08615, partial [Actinobacteria bacterium]|nr:hypothetical protein [Actinomycetota bacterium]